MTAAIAPVDIVAANHSLREYIVNIWVVKGGWVLLPSEMAYSLFPRNMLGHGWRRLRIGCLIHIILRPVF